SRHLQELINPPGLSPRWQNRTPARCGGSGAAAVTCWRPSFQAFPLQTLLIPAVSIDSFHPVVQDWFRSRFRAPTEPQQRGWPAIAAGGHTLISAPTGSGKTLTAFLAIIDRLFREATEGRLADEMRIVYVSPLRALSNDMHRNLEEPLAEITAEAERRGLVVPPITIGLRTGDTSSYQRQKLV